MLDFRSQVDPKDTIDIVFAGDFSIGDSFSQTRGGKAKRNPPTGLEAIAPIVSQHDFFLVNMETVLLEHNREPINASKRSCRIDDPRRALAALRGLGVSSVSLGNNHSMDFGPDALMSSVGSVREAGITVLGAGQTLQEAERPIKLRWGDASIYIFAGYWFKRRYRDEYSFYAAEDRPGVNCLEEGFTSRFLAAVRSIRQSDSNAFVIAFPHWGASYRPPSPRMRRLAMQMLSSGVDMIMGHGAHNLQACTRKDGKIIVFSLGNFLFNTWGNYKNLNAFPFSAIARVGVSRTSGRWTTSCKLYPILSDNTETQFTPRPVSEEEALEIWKYLHAQELDSFSQSFRLKHDSRGWHIVAGSDQKD
jgi:hypothetical protein